LLKFIEEYGQYVGIAGYNDVSIGSPENFLRKMDKQKPSNVDIQFFDADRIATWEHLYFAALNALTVSKSHQNISKSLAMETLLFAAAEKQIVKATEIVGIKSTSQRIAVLILGNKSQIVRSTLLLVSKLLNRQRDEKVLELTKDKIKLIQEIFNIKSAELETLIANDDLKRATVDLLIEKMALSTTKR
jgi:KEOPS complex subunit Cgi121